MANPGAQYANDTPRFTPCAQKSDWVTPAVGWRGPNGTPGVGLVGISVGFSVWLIWSPD